MKMPGVDKWKGLIGRAIGHRSEPNPVSAPELLDELGLLSAVNWQPPHVISRSEYNGLTFLVVDDQPALQAIMATFLEEHGACVEIAANGQLGLDAYLKNPHLYDIIFLDAQMPVMGGKEASERIRASGMPTAKSVPIIAMTGHMFSAAAREAGLSALLRKPFEMEQLTLAISQVLKESR